MIISISSSLASANANAGSAEDRLVYVKLGGLPFVGKKIQRTGNSGGLVTISFFRISDDTKLAVTLSKFKFCFYFYNHWN